MVGDYFSKMAAAQKESPAQQTQSVQNGILTPTMATDAAQSQPKPAPQQGQAQLPVAQQIMQEASQAATLDPKDVEQQIAQLKIEIPQIQEQIQTDKLKPYEGIPLLKEKVATLKKLEAQLEAQIQPPIGINALPTAQGGVASLPSGMNEESFAGGGIVAFSGKNPDGSQGNSLIDMDYINNFGKDNKPVDRSMLDSILDYYKSPSSWEGVKRNVSNTLNALGPVSGTVSTFGKGLIGRGLNYLSDVPGAYDIATFKGPNAAATQPAIPTPVPAPTVTPAPVVNKPASPTYATGPTPEIQPEAQPQIQPQAQPQPQNELNTQFDAAQKILAESKASAAEDAQRDKWLRIMEAGFGVLGGSSPYFGVNVGQGVVPAIKGYATDVAAQRKNEAEYIKDALSLGMKKTELAQSLGLKTRELDQQLKKLGVEEDLYKKHGAYYDALAKAAGTRAAGAGAGAGTRLTIAQMNNAKGIFTTLQKSATDMASPNYGKSTEELWAQAQSMAGLEGGGPATPSAVGTWTPQSGYKPIK